MNRRYFFLIGVTAILAVAASPPAQARVHRFNRSRDRFEPIHRCHIREGDQVWIEGDGVYRVCQAARPRLDGRWTFQVDMVIDPKTNTWGPIL